MHIDDVSRRMEAWLRATVSGADVAFVSHISRITELGEDTSHSHAQARIDVCFQSITTEEPDRVQLNRDDAFLLNYLLTVNSEDEREAARERLSSFVEEQRIPAEIDVLIKRLPSFYDIIRQASSDAGLVFMGMRPPGEEEPDETYARYYGNLMKATEEMPPLAFVLAAEAIEFRKVIGLSDRS